MTTNRTRVGHCKRDETDVYAGRGPDGRDMTEADPGERGWLGNPFPVEDHDSRAACIEAFKATFVARLKTDPEYREAVADLAGKRLGCWCQTLADDGPPCHAEVIAEWAERLAADGDAATTAGVDPEANAREPFRVIRPVDGHPIPADPEELERIWADNRYAEGEAPHPDTAREEYTVTIAEWGDWSVFRATLPWSTPDTVYFHNGMDGQCIAIDGAEGRWHALVNLFAEIVESEGDCRDAEYASSTMPSGCRQIQCKECGGRWSI